MTFYDASANADQKFIAPPKRHFFETIVDFLQILFLMKKFFRKSVGAKIFVVDFFLKKWGLGGAMNFWSALADAS